MSDAGGQGHSLPERHLSFLKVQGIPLVHKVGSIKLYGGQEKKRAKKGSES